MNRQDWQMVMSAFQQLTPHLKQMQRDKMANDLMNNARDGLRAEPVYGDDPGIGNAVDRSPIQDEGDTRHTGGMQEYEMQRQQSKDQLDRRMHEANITKALREPQGSAGDPYAAEKFDLYKRNMNSLITQRESGGASTMDDSMDKLNKDMRSSLGIEWEDLHQAMESQPTVTSKPGMFSGAKEPEYDKTTAKFNTRAGVPLSVAREKLQTFTNRAMLLQRGGGDNGAGGGMPARPMERPAADTPKQLDASTAKTLLAEVGGDKQKARELARQRGFSL